MGIEFACSELFSGETVVIPHSIRCRLMISGQMLRPIASTNNVEASRSCPIDHLSNEGRLVAVNHRVDDSCFDGFAGE